MSSQRRISLSVHVLNATVVYKQLTMAKPKPAMLKACLPLLRDLAKFGSMTVTAEYLIQAGMAVEGGWAWAEDDYEGPVIRLTKEGERVANR